MYQHILIATDGSELANTGVDHGLALAKALGSDVTIVIVTEEWYRYGPEGAGDVQQHPVPNPFADFDRATAAAAAKILQTAAAAAAKIGVSAETMHVQGEHPATGIVKAAEEKGCSLIVMASHGRRGLRRLMLGSNAAEVVASSSIPVLIVR